MRQQEGGNIGVVLQQIALGDGIFGPEELLQIGQMDRLAVGDDVGLIDVSRNFDAPPASAARARREFVKARFGVPRRQWVQTSGQGSGAPVTGYSMTASKSFASTCMPTCAISFVTLPSAGT